MATAESIRLISEAEYLANEALSEVRHEFVDGYVYAMTGASNNHNLIATNVLVAFANHLKGKPCRPYMSDMKVRVGSRYFYPDVMVDCSQSPGDALFMESPRIIVEVLSKSTRRHDQVAKRMAYRQIAALEEYVLIEQDFVEVEVLRRSAGWEPELFYLGDEVSLLSVDLTLSVADIYERVQNADVAEWLAKQENTNEQ